MFRKFMSNLQYITKKDRGECIARCIIGFMSSIENMISELEQLEPESMKEAYKILDCYMDDKELMP